MLIKEKQINKNKKLILEKVDIEKLGVINVIERLDYAILIKLFILKLKDQILNAEISGVGGLYFSSLESDDPSLLDKSLQITTSMNGSKKRKIESDLTDDAGNFRVIHSSKYFKEQSLIKLPYNHLLELKEINELLDKPSFKEVEENKLLYDLCVMLNKKSSKDKLTIDMVHK